MRHDPHLTITPELEPEGDWRESKLFPPQTYRLEGSTKAFLGTSCGVPHDQHISIKKLYETQRRLKGVGVFLR